MIKLRHVTGKLIKKNLTFSTEYLHKKSSHTMPPKRQLVQLTEAREQAKQKRVEVWQTDIFEDKSIEKS